MRTHITGRSAGLPAGLIVAAGAIRMDRVLHRVPTPWLLVGGFAVTFPSVPSQGTAGVDDTEQGLASGLVSTSVQVGGRW